MTLVTDVRTPAITNGKANGNSTRSATCVGAIPIPRAASTASLSASRMPTYVFVTSGGSASRTRAMIVGQVLS
jgi:hypothetical protein